MSNPEPCYPNLYKTISKSKSSVHPELNVEDINEKDICSPRQGRSNIIRNLSQLVPLRKKDEDLQKISTKLPLDRSRLSEVRMERKDNKMDKLRTKIMTMMMNYPKKVFEIITLDNEAKQKIKNDQRIDSTNLSLNKIKQYRKTDRLRFYFYGAFFLMDQILMPALVLFDTLMCLTSLYVWNLYNRGDIEESNHYQVLALDLAIAICFSVELVHDLIQSRELIQELFEIETIIQGALIFDLLWRYFNRSEQHAMVFFYILRSLRVSNLRQIVKMNYNYFMKFVDKLNTDDSQVSEIDDFDDDGVYQRFLLDSIIKLISGMINQSTFLLTLDQYSDHQGYYPYCSSTTEMTMSYLDAAYFTVVSFSTIGYGDIFPVLWYTRMAQVFILCINLTIISGFLTNFIDILFKLSPYDRTYSYKDHVVIVGGITEEQLSDFLEELTQNDLIDREMKGLRFNTGIKIIIVVDNVDYDKIIYKKEPSETQRDLAKYFTIQMGNEVSFLREGINKLTKNWYSAANLMHAKILFAFSWENDIVGSARQNDQLISIIALGVREFYPELRLILILNSTFKDEIKNDSLYSGITAISPFQLNDYVMATSIINPGMGTILQHLLTMKAKVIPKQLIEACRDDKFMIQYIENMQQEIYQFTIPEFYIGLTFKECATMLYIYGLDLSGNVQETLTEEKRLLNDRKMTLFAIETMTSKLDTQQMPYQNNTNLPRIFVQDEFNDVIDQLYSPCHQQTNVQVSSEKFEEEYNILINAAVPMNGSNMYQDQKANKRSANQSTLNGDKESEKTRHSKLDVDKEEVNKTKILINPQNYALRKYDILYVIADSHIVAQDALALNSKTCKRYLSYKTNLQALQKNQSSMDDLEGSLTSMYDNVTNQYCKFDQQKVNSWSRTDLAQAQMNENLLREVFDLEEIKCGEFEDHFLIFGSQQSFHNILQIVRKYTDRPAVLFTDQKLDLFKWKEMKNLNKFKNVFFVQGDFLDLTHLAQLNIKKAFHITIMSNLGQRIFSDAVGICLARIILDLYDRSDFLIELRDHEKISFLDQNPKFNFGKCQTFFYPAFTSGNIHLTSMITGILGRVVYTPNWLQFFQHLTVPNNLSEDSIQQNKMVHCLRVTKQIQQEFKYFGLLQYAFMQHSTSIIAIGVVKTSFSSQHRNGLIDKFSSDAFSKKTCEQYQHFCDDIDDQQRLKGGITNQIQGILKKLIGENYILSNPSFYTEIEESDGIIVLGDLESDISQLVLNPKKISLSTSIIDDDSGGVLQRCSNPPHSNDNETNVTLTENQSSRSQNQGHLIMHQQLKLLQNIPSMYIAKWRLLVKSKIISELRRSHEVRETFTDEFFDLLG